MVVISLGAIMLIKTKINMEQKYVRITEPNLEEFLDAAFMKFSIPPPTEGVTVYDETGTEVDADVFEDVAQQPNAGVFTIRFKHTLEGATGSSLPDAALELSNYNPEDSVILELLSCTSDDTIILEEDSSPSAKRQKQDRDAKHLVESALAKKPGGDRIVKEYNRTKGLTDSSRRQMVNILAADMTETHGMAPPRHVREMYAKGIVSMFPYLMDPYSKNGYEHFYDGESGTGYLAWRLKTIQRSNATSATRTSPRQTCGGPKAKRDALRSPEMTLTEEQSKEAMSFMKYSSDEATIKQKMKITFEYRRQIVLDEEKSSGVLTEFPRFRDVKGLVEQDFILQFGEDVAALSSIILLLHLIPPSAQGRKRPGKVSATQAEKHLVVFMKSGTSVQEHVDAITSSTQPYLLAIGMNRATIHEFFIVIDKQAIPCRFLV
ncbi:uncharacterized protein LOC130405728 [Gadus chalcogrammus]|uniref:uncharacterized protein LOC130405728 n=1 Tax=Gadus chalcogrammus TaxID=1042646 RepID=UPI0024C4B6FD|nr:uncharacterized protein LOC130405728 [Gadus chalcogrammus]